MRYLVFALAASLSCHAQTIGGNARIGGNAALGSASLSAGGTTLLTSLSAYYQLDENIVSGTRNDSTANALNLTDTSANIGNTASGIISRGADAAGANGQLQHANNALYQVGGNTDFTIQVWFNRQGSSATFLPLVCKGAYDPNLTEYYIAIDGSDKAQFAVSNGSSGTTAEWGTAIADSSWHQVIAWYDHTAQTINIAVDNGTPVSVSWTGGTFSGSSAFSLFTQSATGNYYTKQLDEVGFWLRALTSGERTSLWNGGAGLAYSNFGSTP